LPAADAATSPSIRLSRAVGPPTTETVVRGQGFEPGEVVDLTFDTELVEQAMAGGTGRFSTPITVPAEALPGAHTVTATGQSSGLSDSATFTVRTDWPKFHFDLANTGHNPYENVLDPSNVSGLEPRWVIRTDGGAGTSVAVPQEGGDRTPV
jgi:hypothetical protein